MNLTLNLVACDLRYLRHYLGLWLGLVILQAVLVGCAPHLSPDYPGDRGHFFSLSSFAWLVAVLKICLLAVIVTQLVQKDSTIGSTAFWLSRPVSRARLLSGKVLFLVLAIILPSLLVEVGLLFFSGVTPHDTLRSVPQTVFLALLAVATLMMLAAVTSSLARMIFAGGVALVGLPLLWFLVGGAWVLYLLEPGTVVDVDVPVAQPVPPPSLSTYGVGIALVLLVTAVAVVGYQYLTRRTTWSRVILVAGVCLALLSMGYWEGVLGTTSPGLDTEIPDPAHVGVRIEEESLVFDSSPDPLVLFGLRRGKKLFLKGSIAPAPLPPDVAALPAQISASLVLPSGESLANHVSRNSYAFDFSRRDGPLHLDSDRAAILRQALRGTTLLSVDGPIGPHRSELLVLNKDLHDRHRGIGVVYSAQVDFLVLRNAISALRLEKGARYQRGSDWVAIVKVDPSFRHRGRLIVDLNEIGHRLMQDGRKQTAYLLINRSRRQALAGWVLVRDTLSVPPMMSPFFPMLKVRRLRLNFSPPRSGPPIGPDWYDGAELIRVETRDLGWFSKSVRLEDLVMERIAPSPPEASAPGVDG